MNTKSQKYKATSKPILKNSSVTLFTKATPEVAPIKQEEPKNQPIPSKDDSKDKKEEAVAAKSYIKIDTAKLDGSFDTVGELVIAQNFIAQNEK